MTPELSVVVPARDAASTLPLTLAALEAQSGAPAFEVIVVDNGSLDETAALAERFSGVRVLRRARGEGPGAARNDGAHAARAPVLAFTDSDCEPEPGWLRAIADAVRGGADLVVGVVEPVRPPGPWDRTLHFALDTGLFESANLGVRREVFSQVGGFGRGLEGPDEAPFGEDVLFGWAAVRAGARVTWAPEARVRHAVVGRDWRGYVAERRRVGLFCALVRAVPELRGRFLHRRVFLSARSARVDAALGGVALAVAVRRPWPLVLAVPYALMLRADRREAGGRVALGRAAADLVGCASLVRGSVRTGCPVL